ncbi:MAG: ATP synthase F0 subunit B, partial [Desulfohalobiaceae bacterium]
MIDLNITMLIQLVNFLILLAVLNLILIKPIRGIVQQRQEKMAGELSRIEEFNAEAERKMQEYQQALDKARQEGVAIREEFKSQGQKQ